MNPEIDQIHVTRGDLTNPGEVHVPDSEASWKPTRKWVAALAGAVASVVSSWLITGEFGDVERGMIGAALVSLTASYFQANQPTPMGVPEK